MGIPEPYAGAKTKAKITRIVGVASMLSIFAFAIPAQAASYSSMHTVQKHWQQHDWDRYSTSDSARILNIDRDDLYRRLRNGESLQSVLSRSNLTDTQYVHRRLETLVRHWQMQGMSSSEIRIRLNRIVRDLVDLVRDLERYDRVHHNDWYTGYDNGRWNGYMNGWWM